MPGRKSWTIAAALPIAFCAAARADDATPPTDREKALERRVEDLERQLADVNRRLADTGASRSGGELEQRVAELEKLSKKGEDGLFGYWKNGIRMDSAGGAFKLKIGGRIQSDWSWFPRSAEVEAALRDRFLASASKPNSPETQAAARARSEINAGTEFRRARLHVGGTIYRNADFMAEYDFAGGGVKFREVWVGMNLAGVGHVQVGSMKEPFGLEEQTSDLVTNFIERHSGSEAFAPSFNTGVMLANTAADDRVSWAAGIFRDANDAGDDTGNTRSGELNLTARVTGRPWVGAEGDRCVHVGLAGSLRRPSSETAQFRSRPELHLAPAVVDTGALDSDRVRLLEAEAAFVSGPFHAEGEYYRTGVSGTDGGPGATFHAWAVQGGWFLTGETRPYKAENGTFGRLNPKSNYDGEGGAGAVELLGRWDTLDLDDRGVEGGRMNTITFGVTWYLNPNTKVMLDWVRAHVRDAGTLVGLAMRFQVDF